LDSREFSALCARINSALDIRELIDLIGYYPNRAIKVGGLWRTLCPVHNETIFRTLVINPRRNTYHCEHGVCPAHQPGDLIDLLAKARGCSRAKAVNELLQRIGSEKLRLTDRQFASLVTHVASIRDDD
jgi:DNA primase